MRHINAPDSSFYVSGGTLAYDAPSYVERAADRELVFALREGAFCYLLDTRQVGKSSLMIRTVHRLRRDDTQVVVLDLTAIGQNLTPEQWYDGLVALLGEQLGMGEEMAAFYAEHSRLSPHQRWLTALRQVAVRRAQGRLVIFVDEIDAVRSLPFPADEFFAGIRECYNRRRTDPQMERVTFCLLGCATPGSLTQDPRTTPFNIGRRVVVNDFTLDEASPLAFGLPGGRPILERILYWTGGHPYLTQRLCRAVSEEDPTVQNPAQVDTILGRVFLTREARDSESNLSFVAGRVLKSGEDVAGVLDLYRRVREGKSPVKEDPDSPIHTALRLSGLVRVEDGNLHVRNRLYARAFDAEWIRENMPDQERRRAKAAYRQGQVRTAAAAAVALTVMGALAMVAWNKAGEATLATRRAETEAKRAKMREQEAKLASKRADTLAVQTRRNEHLMKQRSAETLRARQQAQASARRAQEQAALVRKNNEIIQKQRTQIAVLVDGSNVVRSGRSTSPAPRRSPAAAPAPTMRVAVARPAETARPMKAAGILNARAINTSGYTPANDTSRSPEVDPLALLPQHMRSGTRAARPLSRATPVLPAGLAQKQFARNVTARVVVQPNGRHQASLVTGSGIPEVDRAILNSMKRWRWAPALQNGVPVRDTQEITFSLNTR